MTDFKKGILTPQVNRRYKLPKGLWKHGFGSIPFGNKKVDWDVVKQVREFIKQNWRKSKKINKHHTSTRLALHISEKLKIEVQGGEVITAAILEGYRYEASVRNAFFWADTDFEKPKF